ncbi:MAG: laccase domain-containing protein [Eubacteriaceae bacterium]|nr:laccase domain-containing protein [Eubacteriaceae bacterium]
MHSLSCFEGHYPIKTLYTDDKAWQGYKGWQDADRRNAALRDYLNMPLKQVIYAQETHSSSVFTVSSKTVKNPAASGEICVKVPFGEYDALVTDVSGILLCIWTADCLPLFLYDTVKHVASVAHCGWRGILGGIVPNTIRAMAECFGSDPEHIIAGFGPGICGNCYVVSKDLYEAFSGRFSPDEIEDLFLPQPNEKYLLDLRMAIKFDLCRAGIRPEEICDTKVCSYESDTYASYRRNGFTEPFRQTLSGIVLL